MSDIVTQLTAKGYQIEQAKITGMKLDNNCLFVVANQTGRLQVSLEEKSNELDYYVVVKGQYYKINLSDTGVEIDKTASDVELSGKAITAKVISGTNITVDKINGNEIILKAGSIAGESLITISYGRYSKDCAVSVIVLPSEEDDADSTIDINTDHGLVEVIWLSEETNTYSPTPNIPDLYTNLEESKRLTPVTWTYYENGIKENKKIVNWIEDEKTQSIWYNYTAEKGKDGKEDNTTSMWANAKNSDGSYFVWIPRYAYRIIYFSDAEYTDVTGFYDGYGMWRADDGNKKYDLEAGIETVTHNGTKYIVHPAFMNDTSKVDSLGNTLEDYERGGWDKNLTGIWVAKYEMSRAGDNTTFLSIPNVQSARSITVGNMYTKSLAYDSSKESHMIKNSEWGAVAYLTQSQYGRNGHEIDVNASSTYITGSGAKIENSEESYSYNTINGAKASTTGNIYGIYDMSGGSWEHVAGYNRLGNTGRFANGIDMIKKDASGNYISTKYATAYANETSDNSSTSRLFLVGKVGDATKEVRTTTQSTNWFSDNSVFVLYGAPFFGRGGSGGEEIYAGIFYSDSTRGQKIDAVSFRMVLSK